MASTHVGFPGGGVAHAAEDKEAAAAAYEVEQED